MSDSVLDRYDADELCEIFKKELDKLGISYVVGTDDESCFAPLKLKDWLEDQIIVH